jgi:hypothetical protein
VVSFWRKRVEKNFFLISLSLSISHNVHPAHKCICMPLKMYSAEMSPKCYCVLFKLRKGFPNRVPISVAINFRQRCCAGWPDWAKMDDCFLWAVTWSLQSSPQFGPF